MKTLFTLACLITTSLFFQSCLQDDCTNTREYVQLNPVYTTADQFRTSEISVQSSATLKDPGKMYFYKNYLLINEVGKGIHFYDLTDPALPSEVAYYPILGNFDMVVKDDLLITDNVIDLISIDISDVLHPRITNRRENFKNEYYYRVDQQYVAYYEKSNIVQQLDCSATGPNENFTFWNGNFWFANRNAEFLNFDSFSASTVNGTGNVAGSGIGGSTARFTLYDQYLYTVTEHQMGVWSTQTLDSITSINMTWGIETIFPYGNKMFIGSTTGMYIYDLQNPTSPQLLSTFTHATACDPVVVQGNTAYVTLRTGNTCSGTNNQLDVIDIETPTNPKLVKTYPMANPRGLSIQGDRLYICEGNFGLKVLDASNENNIKELNFDRDIKAQDVIALSDKYIMVIGSDGFYFIDAENAKKLKIVGQINVNSI